MERCSKKTGSSPKSAALRSSAASIPIASVIGTGNEILLPGFVNGHHHIGLTPVQLGSPDMPLELWFVTRMLARSLNLYLYTLYSAFEMGCRFGRAVREPVRPPPQEAPRQNPARPRQPALVLRRGAG